ncbi:MAG TPA: class I SAM-dependent methyltransferase [Candidatus Hydrogenedentes bacterium]|nr:class I SAM-dependent methyltransferase [Candidatus Hydrogenedentota bacterium]
MSDHPKAYPLVQCVACGGSLTLFGCREGYRYDRCLACGTLQLNPMPDPDWLREAYAERYHAAGHYAEDPEQRNRHGRRVFAAMVKTYADLGGHIAGPVLDYGCGWGGLLDLLRAAGIPAEGADLSRTMGAYCRSRGHIIHEMELQQLAQQRPGAYSGVFMSAVFEHLPEPDKALAAVYTLLRKDGLFISLQPTAGFARFFGTLFRAGMKRLPLPRLHEVICPPWHTVLYTPEGMKRIAERAGFSLAGVFRGPVQTGTGPAGAVKDALELANRAGWSMLGARWPLCICHIFALRKNVPAQKET